MAQSVGKIVFHSELVVCCAGILLPESMLHCWRSKVCGSAEAQADTLKYAAAEKNESNIY